MRAGVLAIALWLIAVSVSAAGLGDLEVESALGEPFAAEVRLRVDDVQQPDFVVRLGTAGEYGRLGLPRPAVIDSITAGPVREDDRGWHVAFRGDRPVKDLVLDIVLIIDKPGARQLRHYPVLLDFAAARPEPDRQPVVRPTDKPQPRERPQPTHREQPASRPQPAPAPDRTELLGSYTVVRGDTLYGIARRVAGGQNVRATAERLFELNPQAFARGDMNLLLAGATLRLPADMAAPEAGQEDGQPVAATTRAPEATRPEPTVFEEDRVELTVPPPPEEIERSLGEWGQADGQTLAQNQGQANRDLAFAKAEMETYRHENDRLQERVDLLERRIADMQRLVELRDRELAKTRDEADRDALISTAPDQPGSGVNSEIATPPADSGIPPESPEDPVDGRDIAMYIGGALLVLLTLFIFYMHRREAVVKEEARQQLLERIERDASIRLPEDL